MNTLGDLRTFFQSVGKTVSDFTGYDFKSDGVTWGLVSDNPVADGVEMAPLDWKIYVKALRSAKLKEAPVNFKPLINQPLFPEAAANLLKSPITFKPAENQLPFPDDDGPIAARPSKAVFPVKVSLSRNPVVAKIVRTQAPAITCPYCGKSGGVIGMKRWHFDKCKDKQ
jgi:hypothetical protein